VKNTKSKRLKAIGLFIVLVALITSYYLNGFQSKPPTINTKEAKRLFEDLDNQKKVSIDVSIKSIDAFKNLVNTKIDPQTSKKVYAKEDNNHVIYIYQIEPQLVQPLMAYISETGTIKNSEEKIGEQGVIFDLENRLRDRETLYQREFQDYNNSKVKYSYQLDRIKNLGKEVDSLKYEIANQQNKAMTALQIVAQVPPGRSGKINSMQKFIMDFIKYMVIYTIIVAFLHYGSAVLVYFLSLLGIRFPNLSSYGGRGYNTYAGYKGYRGYGSYGYGSSKKRRTKRIYREKERTNSENDSEDKQ
jgi:hypothetical protein